MTECAVILYHAHHEKYPKKWIDDCITSIKQQRVVPFEVVELDYAGEGNQLYEGSHFYSAKVRDVLSNIHTGHSDAHNFCCKKAIELGFKYVFNTNIDDFYHYERIYRQLNYLKDLDYDVVSSNMTQIDENDKVIVNSNRITGFHNIMEDIQFSNMDIQEHASKGHNVIAHPACAYSKNFIENSGLLKPQEVPKDDFELWKRSYKKFRFIIAPFTLLYYRIWGGNVSAK